MKVDPVDVLDTQVAATPRSDVQADEAVPGLGGSREAARPTLRERIVTEIRSRPFGYTVLALFVTAGPLLAPLLFPQAPAGVAAAGGLAFGLCAALCAVPQKFL